MRAFKLITTIVAIFGAEQFVRADEGMDIIDHDAAKAEEYPEPTQPENPYSDLDLDTIIRTGTLDGVNPPSTPEEQEVLEALKNFATYSEASKSIDDSFDGLMEQLKMDDLNDMMKTMQEDMEAEFMVSELAKLDLKPDEVPMLTDKQRENIKAAMERLDAMGQDLLDDAYFSQEAQKARMDAALENITQSMDDRLSKIMAGFDEKLEELKGLGADIPGYEEWEENFDEERWAQENPEDAAMINAMFKTPEGGYLGDIDIEGIKANLNEEL